MKHINLITTFRVFLTGIKIFSICPTTIHNGTIETSKTLKWFFMITMFCIQIFTIYFYGIYQVPKEIRTDMYLFLGYLRNAFLGVCTFANTVVILSKSEDLTKIIKKLCEVEKELKLSRNRLNLMFSAVLLEIGFLYFRSIVTMCLLYKYELENLPLRLLVAISSAAAVTPIYATEMIFTNAVITTSKYIDMVNDEIMRLSSQPFFKVNCLMW